MTRAGKQVDVLVKVDVGFHRCGIDPDSREALTIIQGIAALPGLRLRGLLSHAGQAYHAHSEDGTAEDGARPRRRTMSDLAERCRKSGRAGRGGQRRARRRRRGFRSRQPGFTEYRPGNYVYFDRTQVALGAATIDDCALTVLATVVSKPAPDRVILDSGSKTLTNDGARGFTDTPGFGTVIGHDNLLIERLSEEHATVKVLDKSTKLEPGDRVRIIPNHSCVVSNLVDQAWLIDGHQATALEVTARGCIT